MTTNTEFLQAVFKEDAPFAHVTDFHWDPSDIPADQHLIAWRGNWASRYNLRPGNQYFCISVFNPDEKGVARRRNALFLRTRCVVLDDVREKLDADQAIRLPRPSWILETSPGSEQWGYILDEPCYDRNRIDNLNDGLIASELAPDGKDPGQKGVTRYVRLPEGVNNKASKLVNGQPWQCKMLEWHPEHTVSLEALAAPFDINLDAPRREGRVDGAANVPDHPILQIPDIIHIKDVRSDGRFDITCPWVDEHTGGIDNGAAVFTNDDGSLGFKCHHGACEHRTTRDLVRRVDHVVPGWGETFATWRMVRVFSDVVAPPPPQSAVAGRPRSEEKADTLTDIIGRLNKVEPGSRSQRDMAESILMSVDQLPSELERVHYQKMVCDVMSWTKSEFKTIIRALRDQWITDKVVNSSFYDDCMYVKMLDKIYEVRTGTFMTTTAFQNSYCHHDSDAVKNALMGRIQKVDQVDFAPGMPLVFEENGICYGNLWTAVRTCFGVEGDATPWLKHFDVMGWGEHKKRLLQWMAFTLLHPEKKINHMLILGGYEGSGKDYLLTPLIKAMENAYCKVIHGDSLLESFNEYLIATKLLIVNEGDTSDKDRDDSVSNKLKPLAAAPPYTIQVNQKNVSAFPVRNIVNLIMTTNSLLPIRLKGTSRRIYAAWSDLYIRDDNGNVTQEWQEYWTWMWQWMESGGWQHCIWYLRNCVDLSDFNHGLPPPMTDYQRDMQEASKSAGVQTVEAFMRNSVGAFGIDLVSTVDASTTMRMSALSGHDMHLYVDASTLTPARTARLLKDVGCHQLRATSGAVELRVWSLRNHQHYRTLTPEEVYIEYHRQKKVAETGGRRLQSV